MSNEIGLREARKEIGPIADRAHLAGEITYLTRHGKAIAAVVPLDRIKENEMTDCVAGQATMPTNCDRHRDHFWCEICEGFYGVPHTGIHDEPNQHPRDLHSARQCACRPCQQYVAAYEAKTNA